MLLKLPWTQAMIFWSRWSWFSFFRETSCATKARASSGVKGAGVASGGASRGFPSMTSWSTTIVAYEVRNSLFRSSSCS